ncbi:hypothetical protein ACFROC_39215, partial [Nocardia tengchongensis]
MTEKAAGDKRRGRPSGPIYDPLGLYVDDSASGTGSSVSSELIESPDPTLPAAEDRPLPHQPLRARWDPTTPPPDPPNPPRP